MGKSREYSYFNTRAVGLDLGKVGFLGLISVGFMFLCTGLRVMGRKVGFFGVLGLGERLLICPGVRLIPVMTWMG